MEKISNLIKRAVSEGFQKPSTSISTNNNSNDSVEVYSENKPYIPQNEISLYQGKLILSNSLKTISKLIIAFPALNQMTESESEIYTSLLLEQLEKLSFTDGRFEAAVDNVIQTCIYPKPQLADILRWDKKIKIFNYIEVCDFVTQNGCKTDQYFKFIKQGEKKFWIKLTDYHDNKKIFDEVNEKK